MANSQSEILISLRAETVDLNRKLDQVEKQMTGVEKKVGVSIDSMTRDFKRMESAIDPAARATQQYNKDVQLLERAVKAKIVTEARAAQLMEIITAKSERAALATRGYALAATRGLNSSRAMGTAIQQAGYQVGDFAVQVASGQSAMRAFIQQGTQLISMFGPYGAVAGAVLAIGGAIWTFFDRADEAADDATKAANRYKDALTKLTSVQDDVIKRQRMLNGSWRGDLVEVFADKVDIARANLEAIERRLSTKRKVEVDETGRQLYTYDVEIEALEELEKAKTQLREAEEALRNQQIVAAQERTNKVIADMDQRVIDNRKRLREAYYEYEVERYGVARDEQKKADEKAADEQKKSQERNAKTLDAMNRRVIDNRKRLRDAYYIFEDERRKKNKDKIEKEEAEALKKYEQNQEKMARAAERAAEKAAQSWQKQFSKMEDAIIEFSRTGKVSFSDLANSIIEDLIRIQIRSQITEPLSGALGSLFGGFSFDSLFSMFGGSGGPNLNAQAIRGVATGGYISGPGTGTSDSIPAMLSNGEFVVNAAATSRHRELLHAINSGKLRGFATGGYVGGGSTAVGGTMVNVYDQRSGGEPVDVQEQRGPDGTRQIEIFVRDAVRRQIGNGEHDVVAGSRWGVSPSLVRRG